MNIQFRKGTQEDIAFILDVINATFMEHIISTYGEYDRKEDEKLWHKKIRDENHQIIMCDTTDIGFMHTKHEEKNIHIDLLFLLPQYQNKGIGKEIIQNLIQKSIQEQKSLSVASLKSNSKAISFYKKMGFIKINESQKRIHFMYQRKS